MRLLETFHNVVSTAKTRLGSVFNETLPSSGMHGDVFIELRNGSTGELQERREVHNLIVNDASILIARLLKDNNETGLHGAFVLAVGTGDAGWNPMSPPAATKLQRALYSELTRKRFQTTNFVDTNGLPVAYPTNIVDFTTVFSESEAVGPLVEMALLGGSIATNMSVRNPVPTPYGPNSSIAYDPAHNLTMWETQINYLTFPVINKPATSTLGITWRITT